MPALWPSEIAGLYGVPRGLRADGQCIGVLALGGGFLEADVAEAAARSGYAAPEVIARPVGSARSVFQGGTISDRELALDLQVLAGVAPGATIAVYFAGDHIEDLADAIEAAVFDTVAKPKVLSVSWGSPEKFWKPAARAAVGNALVRARENNVTVVAASGDQLATSGLMEGDANVLFPASSPDVLGCGGTAMTFDPAATQIEDEIVWNDGATGSGGGVSELFLVPSYQSGLNPISVKTGAAGRGVPDVAAAAAPAAPGYRIIVGGREIVQDGTSAATPFWAGLIALANAQRRAPIGHVNPLLYANPQLFRPIVHGNNRVDGVGYDARDGWNACTGLGTPRAAQLIAAVASAP